MLSQNVKHEACSAKVIEPESRPGRDGLAEQIEWIKCRGCKGEIGVPFALRERPVECPGCGLAHKLSETILFRPAGSVAPAPPAPARQPEAQNQPAKASVALLRSADVAFNWGIASIVLGWTILVPLIALCCYLSVTDDAKKENMLVPGKATTGFVLALLFGVAQGAAMIAKLNH